MLWCPFSASGRDRGGTDTNGIVEPTNFIYKSTVYGSKDCLVECRLQKELAYGF
jgi:hypothetical protein